MWCVLCVRNLLLLTARRGISPLSMFQCLDVNLYAYVDVWMYNRFSLSLSCHITPLSTTRSLIYTWSNKQCHFRFVRAIDPKWAPAFDAQMLRHTLLYDYIALNTRYRVDNRCYVQRNANLLCISYIFHVFPPHFKMALVTPKSFIIASPILAKLCPKMVAN